MRFDLFCLFNLCMSQSFVNALDFIPSSTSPNTSRKTSWVSRNKDSLRFWPSTIFRIRLTHLHGFLFLPLNFQSPFFQFTRFFGERNLQFDAVLRPGSFRGNRHVSKDGDGNQMTHLKTCSLRGSQILQILELDHCSFAGIWLSGWNTLFFQCPKWRWGNRLQRQ